MSSHPVPKLIELATKNGWTHETTRINNEPNPNAISIACAVYPTLISPKGVKVALDSTDIYVYKNRVMIGDPGESNPHRVTLAAIIAPKEIRGQGFASLALKELQKFAKQLNITIVGEPVQMQKFKEKKSLTTKQLIAWYKRHGWTQRTAGDDKILEYRPK